MKRATYLLLGALVLACVWFSPVPELTRGAFTAHMTMHMGVVAVAAPLLAFALAGSPIDPVRRWPALFPPIPISVAELVVVWAWHTPGLHEAARRHTGALLVEQGTFLVAGAIVWLSAFGGAPEQRRGRVGAGVAALLLTSMHMTLLGALLALAPRPLYAHARVMSSLTPLEDQHLGGAIMLIVGGIVYLAGGLWLTAGLVRAQAVRAPGLQQGGVT